jgi:hypothetical protein
MKYGMNRINNKLFIEEGWFNGKGIELHHWGPKIKLHK